MSRIPLRKTLVALLSALSLAGTAEANGVYRYTEKDGTIIYTNVAPSSGVRAKKLRGTFTKPPREPGYIPKARQISLIEWDEHIESAAARYKVPVNLVRAIMHAESNFNTMALSPKGASGLMQLMPGTAQEMFVKDIFDAKDNIEGGTRYLRVLANEFDGDMVKMIAAYNAGPEAVRKYKGNVPPYQETQLYVKKVLDLYFQYKAAAADAATVIRGMDSQG